MLNEVKRGNLVSTLMDMMFYGVPDKSVFGPYKNFLCKRSTFFTDKHSSDVLIWKKLTEVPKWCDELHNVELAGIVHSKKRTSKEELKDIIVSPYHYIKYVENNISHYYTPLDDHWGMKWKEVKAAPKGVPINTNSSKEVADAVFAKKSIMKDKIAENITANSYAMYSERYYVPVLFHSCPACGVDKQNRQALKNFRDRVGTHIRNSIPPLCNADNFYPYDLWLFCKNTLPPNYGAFEKRNTEVSQTSQLETLVGESQQEQPAPTRQQPGPTTQPNPTTQPGPTTK